MANPFSNVLDGYVPGKKKGWQEPMPSPLARQLAKSQAETRDLKQQLAEILDRMQRLERGGN